MIKLKSSQAEGQTTMSNYVWQKREEGKELKVTWRILEKMSLILTQYRELVNYAQGENSRLD